MRKLPLLFLSVSLLMSTAGLAAAQPNIAGDWEGTLKAGAIELRLALHVVSADDGGFKATLDNIDQGGFHIPVTSIALTGPRLTLRIDALSASFDGTVGADGTAIAGTWSQRASVPLVFARAPKRADVKPSDVDGTWAGTLDAGGAKLRLLFHITNTPYGLVATMDSPDQGAQRLVTAVSRTGSSLRLEIKQIAGTFEGTVGEGRTIIDGTRSTAPACSIREKRASISSRAIRPSMRASTAPRQKCSPNPKATWPLASRVTRRCSASSPKTLSSRFADA